MTRNPRIHVALRVALLFLTCLAGIATATSRAHAEFATLRPAKDSTLIESATGAFANGSGPAIFAGRVSSSTEPRRRALLAFDVAGSVPPGSTVISATLTLNLSATNAGAVWVSIHRVQADWGEGAASSSGGGGVPSTPGDSTWRHRYYDGVYWDSPGGDFDSSVRAAALVDQPGFYSWGSTPEMVVDIQSWLDDPAGNYGWILIGDETRSTTVKRFDSRESSEESARPVLYVEFVPPCAPDPRGPGYWEQQCSALLGEDESGNAPSEPRFSDQVIPCAEKILGDLGLPDVSVCAALAPGSLLDCRQAAIRKLSVLVLNVCAARLQTSCPAPPSGEGCAAKNIGELLRELSRRILRGECWRASGCGGASAD
jgi:hypothetical protein